VKFSRLILIDSDGVMDLRFEQLQAWLAGLARFAECTLSTPVAASSDASFRRYFRVWVESDAERDSWIIMDAPPTLEDCRPFIKVSAQLAALGLHVPRVVEACLTQGFLLLSDLGQDTYLSQLNEANAERLYGDALGALVRLQAADARSVPPYDAGLLTREMALFSDWLGERHCGLAMNGVQQQAWVDVQQQLIHSALAQPQVYVHRDFHSRNLMVCESNNPGILDFQDAVCGALTYDAVSLLRDCYKVWPKEQVREWQRQYFFMLCEAGRLTKSEWASFVQAMDWMGIQRHLKAAGIFARLYHRDGKDGYLNDIPPTLNYIVEVGALYAQMTPLVAWTERLAQRFAEVGR
jgi:aminoglycoside/choline kinase family phosphotransferase